MQSAARGKVEVRRTPATDFDSLFAMKSDPDDIRWSGFAGPPERSAFFRWFMEMLGRSDRIMFTALVGGETAGYVHFTRTPAGSFEASSGVRASFRGFGHSTAMIVLATAALVAEIGEGAVVDAWICRGNRRSEASYRKAGFLPAAEARAQVFHLPIVHRAEMARYRLVVGALGEASRLVAMDRAQ